METEILEKKTERQDGKRCYTETREEANKEDTAKQSEAKTRAVFEFARYRAR